jgi:hypothetical protein
MSRNSFVFGLIISGLILVNLPVGLNSPVQIEDLGTQEGGEEILNLSISDMIQNPMISLSGASLEDVIVSWDPPENMTIVLNYGIFAGTYYNSSGAGYAFLSEVSKGTNSFVHAGAGKGDPETYYYMIYTNTSIGSGGHPQQVVKLGHSLVTGANILSLPIIPNDTKIETVLESITSEYNFVRAYDASDHKDPWKSFRPGRGGDISEIRTGMVFVVSVPSGPAFLAIPGLVPDETVISLEKGWNLVSLVSANSLTVAAALDGIPYTKIEGFDPLKRPYRTFKLGPDDILAPGDCLWIYLKSSAVWTIPFGSSTEPPSDTTPPTILSVMDSPDPQISGGVVAFDAIVTDDEGVSGVSIEIFDTVGSSLGSFPMIYDAPSGKWKYSSSFSNLGIYSYTVIAIDTSDNPASATGTFEIIEASDTTPPTISSISDSRPRSRTTRASTMYRLRYSIHWAAAWVATR